MGLASELRRRNVFRMAALYTVAAWLIMQVAEVVIALANLPDWIGPILLSLLVIGFPIALVFSWFYELTPEGLALEKDVAPAESITEITGRRMDFIVISILTAAVLLFAWHTWSPSTPIDKSIAVLAFENMSGDPEQDYFSDGISEELLNALAQVPELRVISRTSSFTFRGKDVDIPTVARRLNVAHVLEGSVRKMGNRVRITAQLIDASTDSHLWSETYDRELANIFAVQDEIAATIVEALKERLGLQVDATPRVITAANVEAYEAYLRGRHLMVQRTRGTVEGAVREFEKAITLDPKFALAHAELSIATVFLSHYAGLTVDEAVTKATPHAERAMALDPSLAETQAAAGWISYYQQNTEEALTHFQRAIRINSNYAIVYNWMGIVLDELGHYDEGLVACESALWLDPLSIPTRSNYVRMLINRNRLAEAERELEKLASLHPSFAARARGQLSSLGGKWANAVLADLDALRHAPEMGMERNELSLLFAILELEKEALSIAQHPLPRVLRMLGRPGDAVTAAEVRLAEVPFEIYARRDLGRALASAGDYARARPILEEMWQRSGGRLNDLFEIDGAAALIAIRRDAGEEAGVGELLAAIRGNVRRHREAGITAMYDLLEHVDYQDGLAAYLSGEHESGLALIARASEDGFFIPLSEAYLQALYDDPGFAAIRAAQEARQTQERQEFLATVCKDNPYETVWQPAEETCEQLVTTLGD